MVTDRQVRRLYMFIRQKRTKAASAAAAGMDEKTARKYLKVGKLPSEIQCVHKWQTRINPFALDWEEIKGLLSNSPGLESKTIFEYLARKYPGRYQEGQLRTLQRHIKRWRATEGPSKEVYFPQVHYPGQLSQSDFTSMNQLAITIRGELFDHLVYHFVLPYSNWETGTICFSESFESLSAGYQNAIWELGGVIPAHRTDRMSAAVNKECNPERFTNYYRALLSHYGVKPECINIGKANEDGDVEQLHYRLKQAVDQALLLRGSRDFGNREAYESFLRRIFKQRNQCRSKRFKEEQRFLKLMPKRRFESLKRLSVRVGPSSTIRVLHNTYSVESRLIGEQVEVRVHLDYLALWYGNREISRIPRVRGEKQHRINYRHIINWLVRKPGAFKNYRYKSDMFPASCFRVAYDRLNKQDPLHANREYLQILQCAAWEGESLVESLLNDLISEGKDISASLVRGMIKAKRNSFDKQDVQVATTDITNYDELLQEVTVEVTHE